ncbi:uncharacterized protein LODBEIA_P57080 [Lodderomyces beijingensis]|uniref:Sphingomyelin phosphodiesterase n=1 Tax=Lodderomyces beijingensis TaxID=1775926 RepID=A0ABP0ZI46_9ASCO
MLLVLLALFIVYATGYEAQPFHYKPPVEAALTDEEICKRAVAELHNVEAATDLDECTTCKTRLQIAKFIGLTRPDLVPQIFLTWCVEAGYDEVQCHMNYGYSGEDYSSTGNDFAKVASLMNPSGLDGDYFCYYHDKKCHVLPETPNIDMSNMWPSKPKNYQPPDGCGEVFHVLHISDVNLQLDYTVFAEANCSQSLCCSSHCRNTKAAAPHVNENLDTGYYDSTYRKNHFEKGKYLDITKVKKRTWTPARQFGEYTCDTPALLLNNTMSCIRDLHQNHLSFEFALFTGGTVDHSDRCYMSKDKNIKSQETSYRIIKKYLDKIDVIPTFGTRDIFPMNQLPQKHLSENSNSYQWQFDFLADLWSELDWVDHDTAKQIRYSQTGFSLITLKGLKVISLNSNVWNTKNLYCFWNMLDVDSHGMWKFLIEELIDSERNHQRVWIIAHLPPSQQALPISTKIFTSIIERFSPKVIAAIFFGHVQADTFMVQYGCDGSDAKELKNAVNHALVGPSVSPYSGYNPAWKYYAVDEKSFSIVNSFTYYTPLDKSFYNDGAEPNWEFAYSARDLYDPELKWPSDWTLNTEWWHHVAEDIGNSPETELLYQRLETRWFSEAVLDNTSYCKVTSFSVEARKQCMVTDDQDDYIKPTCQTDYVPLIHVKNQEVEYVEADMEEDFEAQKQAVGYARNWEEKNNNTESTTPQPQRKKQQGKSIHLAHNWNHVNYVGDIPPL